MDRPADVVSEWSILLDKRADEARRATAAGLLYFSGVDEIEGPVREWLESDSEFLRSEALYMLVGCMRLEGYVDTALAWLHSVDEGERHAAAGALAQFLIHAKSSKREQVEMALLRALLRDSNKFVHAECAVGLRAIKGDRFNDGIFGLVGDFDRIQQVDWERLYERLERYGLRGEYETTIKKD